MQNSENPEDGKIEASQFVRIPTRRIGVVIGKNGSNRTKIEEATQSKIIIDSDTGEVEIRPTPELEDPVLLLKARDIVKAIGRGFSTNIAMNLANDDYFLEVIRLKSFVGDQYNRLKRVKSRVIGSGGKTRASIESLTSTTLIVLGSTVSILGKLENLGDAKEAVIKIINGSDIDNVINQLEEKRRQHKIEDQSLWEETDKEKEIPEEEEEEEEKEVDPFSDSDETE